MLNGAAGDGRAPDLPADVFALRGFNKSCRFTPAPFEAWMAVTRRVPHAVLWLMEDNAAGIANPRRHAATAGVAPERIRFAPRCDTPRYRARLVLAHDRGHLCLRRAHESRFRMHPAAAVTHSSRMTGR